MSRTKRSGVGTENRETIAQSSPTRETLGLVDARRRPLEVAQVGGEDPAGAQRARQGHQRRVDVVGRWQVVERVADAHHRVGVGNRVDRQRQPFDRLRARRGRTREVEHRRRRVGREHAEAGVDEIPGEQPAPTPELQHQPVPLAHRCQPLDDPRGAEVGVEPEASVVHEREVGPVVGLVHADASANASATAAAGSGASTTSSSDQVPIPTTGTSVRSANAISESVP